MGQCFSVRQNKTRTRSSILNLFRNQYFFRRNTTLFPIVLILNDVNTTNIHEFDVIPENNIIEENNIIPDNNFMAQRNYDYAYNYYIQNRTFIKNCNGLDDFCNQILQKETTKTRTRKIIMQYRNITDELKPELPKLKICKSKFEETTRMYKIVKKKLNVDKIIYKKQLLLTRRLENKTRNIQQRLITSLNIENMKLYNMHEEQEEINQLYDYSNNYRQINLVRLRNKLPDEILDIISSYLPYSIRIQMINHFHNPMSYFDRLGATTLNCLAQYLSEIIYIKSLPPCFAISQYYYNDIYHLANTREEKIILIKTFISISKKEYPEAVFNFMKMISILKHAGNGRKYYHYVIFNNPLNKLIYVS